MLLFRLVSIIALLSPTDLFMFISILNDDGTFKDYVSWSESFDNIPSHHNFLAYCNNETDITTIYEITNMLFRIELNVNKSIGDGKVITDAKWNKSVEELTTIKDATQLNIENDIAIWEVVSNIMAFPSKDSDQAHEELAYNKQKIVRRKTSKGKVSLSLYCNFFYFFWGQCFFVVKFY